jgi:hypothetical protein
MQRIEDLRLRISSSFLVIIYVLYPSIANQTFSLFDCIEGPQGKLYSKKDLNFQCWDGEHVTLCLVIGLPMCLIWIIGFPSFIYFKLRKNLDSLKQKRVL